MEALHEFTALVQHPSIDLGRGAALAAAHIRPPVAVDRLVETFDDLAAAVHGTTFVDLCAFVGRDLQFVGNRHDYGDPENSMLDAVVARRTGLPITLSIVVIELGRRIGVAVDPIGMPGHFLVRDRVSGAFCDPFAQCALLDVEDCRRIHDAVHGGRRRFTLDDLAVVSPASVLARMLANLEQSRLALDRARLRRVLELHAAVPSLGAADLVVLGDRLARVGDHATAARVVERAVPMLSGAARASAERTAVAFRAVLN